MTEKPVDKAEKPADKTEKPVDKTEKPADKSEKPANKEKIERVGKGGEMTIFTKGLVFILHDFSWWTSTHGIPHIGLANARWLRITWIIIVLICIGAFIWQFVTLLNTYLAYNVNTETEVDAYVAGTEDADYGFSGRLDGERQQSATKFTLLMSEILYSSSKAPEKYCRRSTSLQGAQHAYTYDDLVISCTYNAQSCNVTDFQEFYDPTYGVCHMFNFDGTKNSSRAGPLYGLRMVIRTDQAKYLPWTETAGVIMSIHGKDEVPFPDVFGYFAAPGTATSLVFDSSWQADLPLPLRVPYTQDNTAMQCIDFLQMESCFRNCLQERIITDCKCYDPAYRHGDDGGATPSCAVGNQSENCKCDYLQISI
ncbi:Amiloride-sensitive sodium channel [Cooperia oncophora]